jgi:hypothetical protein
MARGETMQLAPRLVAPAAPVTPLARLACAVLLVPFRELATAWSRWQENHAHTRRLLRLR